MLLSVLEDGLEGLKGPYPELDRARVLITGLSPTNGVDLARAFAEHKARLVLQHTDTSPEFDALLEVLAATADELHVTSPSLTNRDDTVEYAKSAAQAFSGLEAVVNLIHVGAGEVHPEATMEDIDDAIADKLRAPYHITDVVANRMRTTWCEGSITNIVTLQSTASRSDAILASMIRTALANMTRHLADHWAEYGISINAVGPTDPNSTELSKLAQHLKSQYDIAKLALYLASDSCGEITGQTFEAAGAFSIDAAEAR